ncbi:uncharacterized protein LOC112056376 [Bicyclus anynana]|uniref:Uncharacterized protein LOC112056376 n=1 Tax=Bicyclus anynana TaxID=110368 RepID=A0ABM3LV51_BICAN|nr:uncharacterized protein LOC112056376 [Bicyclus anynana]
MCVKRFSILILSIFSVVKNGAVESRKHNILQLLSNGEPRYVAVYYDKGKDIEGNDNLLSQVDLTQDISPDIDSLGAPYEEKAYLLYHALRTAEEREELDEEAAREFEETKQILRQALRTRCKKLSSCYRRCPKKLYITCTTECRETYDDYDVCQPKKKNMCKTPKCGHTMPPSWLRRI